MKIKMNINGQEGWFDPRTIKVEGIPLANILEISKRNEGDIKEIKLQLKSIEDSLETHRQTINKVGVAARKGGLRI